MSGFSKTPQSSDIKMSELQKGKFIGGSKSVGNSGLPNASNKPALKSVAQKGIMGAGGSLGAGETGKRPSLKGFGKA